LVSDMASLNAILENEKNNSWKNIFL
jgi:hypothetical protein